MFNRLKKRVQHAQEHHRQGRIHRDDDDEDDTNTFGHRHHHQQSSNNSNNFATDAAYGLASAAKLALEKHALRHQASSAHNNTHARRHLHLMTNEASDHFVDPLARFHGCIEAADALAAASAGGSEASNIDQTTGLADCSVLVSPDGDLLLIPQGEDQKNLLTKSRRSKLADDKERNDSSPPSNSPRSMFTELMLNGKDDYESAVFLGSDLHADGDRALNGFSSRGWSIPATTAALQQTEQSLGDLAQFCENLVLSHKELAAQTSGHCDKLRIHHPSLGGQAPSVHPVDSDWEIVDPRSSDFVMTPSRVGPLLYPGSSLCQAMMAVEHYYAGTAEAESQRWRMASLQRKGVLPSIRRAHQQFAERSKKRQQALDGASQQARKMEDRLNRLKTLAERSWETVYYTEHRVTKRMEELMTERSRARERERIENLKMQEEKRLDHARDGSLGTTTEEIWSIVSKVAESMEDGSFEPLDLPSAPFSMPTDMSKDVTASNDSLGMDVAESSDSSKTLPVASREQVEQELRLPELRSTAMAADEAVADAADALMNMLSNLDTARRSAKCSAETNLISACNAQSACLRSLVKLERASLEERLNALRSVEEVIDRIEPRKDLDKYITVDKQECGGTGHLGDDDDGGVAAALAILSRHVEGNMGADSLRRCHSDPSLAEGTVESEVAAGDKIEQALDAITLENNHLNPNASLLDETKKAREAFEESIDLICKAAQGMGTSARAKRAKICYALNGKRSSSAEIRTPLQFDGLCRVFHAVLSGCNNEDGGTAIAKICIMLASTFYLADGSNPQAGGDAGVEGKPRDQREFVRNRLKDHPLWRSDVFWDATFGQQITESLTHSGVMANFEKDRRSNTSEGKSEWLQHRKTNWYDLTQLERVDAAAQVHAVVFAQLGALAHSMIELGCGLERSTSFVRRMSIRNQLPISQRTMLLQHLMSRDGVDRRESSQEGTSNDAPSVRLDEEEGAAANVLDHGNQKGMALSDY